MKAHEMYKDITFELTTPSEEGSGYFSMYNSNFTICESICEPTFVYASVKK